MRSTVVGTKAEDGLRVVSEYGAGAVVMIKIVGVG